MRHPTMDGIYGVSLRQQYKSDRYADDGYLFLLWDFRNESMPLIHGAHGSRQRPSAMTTK